MDHFIFIKSMLDYIENRVAEDISADEVALAAGFSLPHFRAVFRNAMGQSLTKYITYRRLCHAASELVRTKRSIADIAVLYSFGSHDVFIRAFKRYFGMTPSEFRQGRYPVGRELIVPGIFGPSVRTKRGHFLTQEESLADRKVYPFSTEEVISMNRASGTQGEKDAGVLYGVVPRVSYFGQEAELTPFISCLRACLTYMGQEIDYSRLMAGSGAAFRLMWNTKYWDGGNVDMLCVRKDATEPIRKAFRTAGREFGMLCKPGKEGRFLSENAPGGAGIRPGDKAAFIELIKNEIDSGRPVIGFGIIGPPEPCIIAGYRDNGETLLGWSFFQDMPEFAGGIGKEPCGYFIRKGWFEYPETIALAAVGKKVPVPDERTFLKDTLDYAVDIMETPRVGDRAGGYAAYEAWAGAMLDASAFPKDAPLPMLMERLMCQCDAVTMVGEGRWLACGFLKQAAGRFPEAGDALESASEMFGREHKLAMEMGRLLEGFEMSERCAGVLARPEIRRQLAVMIRECAEFDRKAAQYVRKATLILKGQAYIDK